MTEPKEGDTIVCWFSCGVASAIAVQQTLQRWPKCNIRVVNNPVAEEHEDNRRFLTDVASWLGIHIETARSSYYPSASAVDVWEHRQYMSGPQGAPCTLELKKKPRQEWEAKNPHDFIVLGFTFDEIARANRFRLTERSNLLTPLIDRQITKQDCFELLRYAGIAKPKVYDFGYPNANCIGCVKSASPAYWNHVRKMHPDVFAARAEQSRKIGARLVILKRKRIFLDELPSTLSGKKMKASAVECGIFCEEST